MRGHIAHILATVLMVVSLGAAQRPNKSESVNTRNKATSVAPAKTSRTKPYQIGTASWYGSYFQGRATASGEPYDMYDLIERIEHREGDEVWHGVRYELRRDERSLP